MANKSINNYRANKEALENYNMENFVEYCREFNAADSRFHATQKSLLQYWVEGKGEYLYDLMGHELTLTENFQYARSQEELERDVDQMRNDNYNFIRIFKDELFGALDGNLGDRDWDWLDMTRNFPSEDNSNFYEAARDWFTCSTLLENRVNTKLQCTLNGKVFKVNAGEKVMRAMRRICEQLPSKEYLLEAFDKFRQAHAMLLTSKGLTGELCLSIHPLDYATASDNDNGWSSCMSWQEEGCYRLGTVEMMNSPLVICAYLRSDVQEMSFGGYRWPSKKWRAWIIVNPEGVMCNRNYPYENDDLSRECLRWVKELAHNNLGWDFTDNIRSIEDWDNDGWNFIYRTDFMYNDVNSSMLMSIASNLPEGEYDFDYSGIANCMNCGEEIPFDGYQESSTLCCRGCREVVYCSHCGQEISENNEEILYGPNDEPLCDDCYNELTTCCERCGSTCYVEDTTYIAVPFSREKFQELTNESKWSVPVCAGYFCCDCLDDLNITFLDENDVDRLDFSANEWTSRYTYDFGRLVDPRVTPLATIYQLCGYWNLDENDEPRAPWAKEEVKRTKIKELYDHYRNYVISELGEAE